MKESSFGNLEEKVLLALIMVNLELPQLILPLDACISQIDLAIKKL